MICEKTYTIEELLASNTAFVGTFGGTSMLPMLKERRDTIVVQPKTQRLKALDVALYRVGEKYILHRVIKVLQDGYLIRGDNCYFNEYVKEDAVIGVLTEFYCGEECISVTDDKYLKYAKKRVKSYRIRRFFYFATKFPRRAFSWIKRKLKKRTP